MTGVGIPALLLLLLSFVFGGEGSWGAVAIPSGGVGLFDYAVLMRMHCVVPRLMQTYLRSR